MQKLLVFAGLSTASAIANSGEHIECLGDRAHILRYDVEGEENNGSSMDAIKSANITLEAARQHDQHCDGGQLGSTPSGDKLLCYGVNQNSDCSGAKSTIPLENGAFECKDCYVAVKADAFYNLDYNMLHLNSVQVGLKDIHVVGSASLHKTLSGSTTAFKGSYVLPGSDKTLTLIDKLVGCPVCVKVKISVAVPTTLDYELDLSAQADITAGAKIDAHLADRWAKYDSKTGWSYPDYTREISASPILAIENAQVTANLNLGIRTSVQVNVDDIVWYHLDLNPKLPLTASVSGSIWPVSQGDFCLKGDAEVDIGHEADLDWNLIVWHEKKHWGPYQDYKWTKPGVINYCKSIGGEVVV